MDHWSRHWGHYIITNQIKSPFLFSLKKDDLLLESLAKCAVALKLNGAAISGLGALQDPILGDFDPITQRHKPKIFPGLFEISSLNGNITKRDGEYHVHIHVALSDTADANRPTISGHLFDSKIGIIADLNIVPYF